MSEELDWDDISLRKKQLLANSDWTQLPDSGLIEESVLEWRKWRAEVRSVTQKKYRERIPATLALQKLKSDQPETVFGDSPMNSVYRRDGSVYTREELQEAILDAVRELGLAPGGLGEEMPEMPSLATMTNVKIAKRFASAELDRDYHDKLAEVSPAPEKTQLYLERLNQALDYRSKTGMDYHPLLDAISTHLNRPIEEVAAEIVKKHMKMIAEFEKIESEYLTALRTVRECDTIDDIAKVLQEYSGH